MSFPVLAGHTQSGNWCECGTVACLCDEGERPPQGMTADSSESEISFQDKSSSGLGDELLFIFLALVLIKLRA